MIPPIGIGPLGPSEWSIGGTGGIGGGIGALGTTSPLQDATGSTGGSGGFGSALANAINSLDGAQSSATVASQQLATGQLTDPTKAVTAVENAALSMDFAASIRNQFDSAATTLFQTQV